MWAGSRRKDAGLNVRVWTPRGKQEVFEKSLRKFRCCRVSGLIVQPSSQLRACMEIADRVHIGFARSRRLDIHWFSRPRLLTVAPYLC